MNYFYVDGNEFIIGYTNLQTAEELKSAVPIGCKFYFYKPGDDLKIIAETSKPAGIGTGKKIDY